MNQFISDKQLLILTKDLDRVGVSIEIVQDTYRLNKGRVLDLNEMVKVSAENEGSEIKFETLDHISITVPVHSAAGSWNKVD